MKYLKTQKLKSLRKLLIKLRKIKLLNQVNLTGIIIMTFTILETIQQMKLICKIAQIAHLLFKKIWSMKSSKMK